jgi:hypothetical protein
MPRGLVKPNIPPDSCGHIDRTIELAENLVDEMDADIRNGYTNIIKEEMEIVRTINIQLRTASKFWHDKYKRK